MQGVGVGRGRRSGRGGVWPGRRLAAGPGGRASCAARAGIAGAQAAGRAAVTGVGPGGMGGGAGRRARWRRAAATMEVGSSFAVAPRAQSPSETAKYGRREEEGEGGRYIYPSPFSPGWWLQPGLKGGLYSRFKPPTGTKGVSAVRARAPTFSPGW
jgi:hypothetical protein